MAVPRLYSLRNELLLSIGALAAAALILGVASVTVLYGVLDQDYAALYIGVLFGLNLSVLVGYIAYQVNEVVVRPLREAMDAAEAIADGNLARRIKPGNTTEFANLAFAVNRMTDRLIEDRVHLVRAEKLAVVGRLAAGIAHEVGNPLGAISGYTHVLKGAGHAPDVITGLERETERIDRIVRGLLDYARPAPLTTARVDVNAVARNVLDLLMTQGVLKTVDLRFSPAVVPAHIMANRHDLEQMLVNLLLNAVDAMGGRGSLSLVIRVATRSHLMSGSRPAHPARPASAPSAGWRAQRPAMSS